MYSTLHGMYCDAEFGTDSCVSITHYMECTITMELWHQCVYSTLHGMYCDAEFGTDSCVSITHYMECTITMELWHQCVYSTLQGIYYDTEFRASVCLFHTAVNVLWHWICDASVSTPHCRECTVTLNLYHQCVYSLLRDVNCNTEFGTPVCLFHTSDNILEHWIWDISFYPLDIQAAGVLSLPASVRLSVRPSVCLSVTFSLFAR